MKKGTLIYNPVAGRRPGGREREVRRAVSVLRRAGMEVDLAPTTQANMAHELAQAAVARGADVIIVCGGDGTINEVVNGMALSPVPLAILPGGTANILARELRIPLDPVRAARELSHWKSKTIALGRARWQNGAPANGNPTSQPRSRYYTSVAGIGYDAQVVYKLSAWLKEKFGVMGYVMEALRQWVDYPFPEFHCHLGGRQRRGTFTLVHRTRLYAGWLHMAPPANLFAPHLAVCSFPSRSRLRYLYYAIAVLARQHLNLPDVSMDQCTEAVCTPFESGSTIYFELDGELAGALPATFEVVPDALTLLVPEAGS